MLKKYFNRLVFLTTIFLWLSQVAIIPVLAATGSQVSGEEKQYTSKRLAGEDRIGTSLAIAEEYSSLTLQNVILAFAYDFPDALSGSVLAKKLNAPILLVGGSSRENSNVFNFIKNHLDPNGNVYILGGTGVISDDIQSSIQALGFKNFIRLGGADRVETNLKIVDTLRASQGTPVVITTQNDFPDALSISAVAASKGYPILLSDLNSIDQKTLDVINSIKPDQILIIGGTGVVSSDVENLLKLSGSDVTRISGADRFETSLAVSNYFKLETDSAIIAAGYNFADALAGSSLAAKLKAQILLTDNKDIIKQKQLLDSTNITNLYILGGTGAVSESVVSDLISVTLTFSGWLADSDCSPQKTDPTTMGNQCLKCPKCVAGGYGISLKQSDGTYIYYKFDENGHNLAKDIAAATTCLKVPAIRVQGKLTGELVTIDSKNYQVLKVYSISESSTLESIAVTTPATKLVYSVGDELDITGLQVTGTYKDSTTALQAITPANVSGFDSSAPAAKQILTITAGGKTTTYPITVSAGPTVQTFTGYIIDEDCFAAMPDDPGADTKNCLSMSACAASGYGIAVLQADGTYKFYYFDGEFAPEATGAQIQAADLIKNTTKQNHISVKVTGILNGNSKVSPADGKSYPVITVSALVEN
ncbi:MAG TPA: cell wall-binding repeat-containing protein [Desulfitobacteriaceae bacterium]|nr:cell wall-binding repeat-containing protein [Desulfitobacteriaceae bacterium]